VDVFEFMNSAGTGRNRRLQVFRALLQILGPEQRFSVSARLTQDVLAAIVDEVMPVTMMVRCAARR
jgi:hypothetical protein